MDWYKPNNIKYSKNLYVIMLLRFMLYTSALSASSSVMSTSTESSSTMISKDMLNDSENIDTVTHINNIAYNYVGITLCGIGIFGNILNLIVLTRPKLKGKLT